MPLAGTLNFKLTRGFVIARYKQLTRKKAKEDAKEHWSHVVSRWLEPHLKMILSILVVAVVVAAAVWFFVKRDESLNMKAQTEYFDIMKIEDPAARVLKLEEFVLKDEGYDVSKQALMVLGEYYFDKGDFEKALSFYKKAISSSEGDLMYYVAVDSAVPSYVKLGRALEAAELYIEGSRFGADPSPLVSKLKAAELYELAGKFDEAKKIYEEIMKHESAPQNVKLKAEEKLLWISVSK